VFQLSFIAAVNYRAGWAAAIATGDVNGDGKPDVVVADPGSDGSPDGSVLVFVNRGDGTLVPAVGYAAGRHPSALALADIDRDGDRALAAAGRGHYDGTAYPDAGVTVLHNRADGTFAAQASIATGPSLDVALGDLDGDGWTDVVLSGSAPTSTGVRVLWNEGGT